MKLVRDINEKGEELRSIQFDVIGETFSKERLNEAINFLFEKHDKVIVFDDDEILTFMGYENDEIVKRKRGRPRKEDQESKDKSQNLQKITNG